MLHVMIDLYHCNPALLQDEAFLHRVLDEYPDFIGMDKVSPVVLRDIKTSNPLDDGFSGFVIIATSHVSLHAWPPYGMVNLDIFSCEEFSVAQVVHFAKTRFHTEDVEVHAVERALRSPRISNRLSVVGATFRAPVVVMVNSADMVNSDVGHHEGSPYHGE